MRSDKTIVLSRRQALIGAAALVGATLSPAALTAVLAEAHEGGALRFFTNPELQIITDIVDRIIPATDTPGAVGVGVPRFMDSMMADWASTDRRDRFRAGIAAINEAASGDYLALTDGERQELVVRLDAEAFSGDDGDRFFRDFKQLTLFGYYSSEVGASEELAIDLIPGGYDPCVPVNEHTRTWAT